MDAIGGPKQLREHFFVSFEENNWNSSIFAWLGANGRKRTVWEISDTAILFLLIDFGLVYSHAVF